ncbi:Uncharacterised protein [Escherichia coli]|nr:Uncharacterised protein [Escherichia coli]
MAYLFISLLFVLLFAEIKITQRKFSPTIVLITLWIGVLIVTQIYSSALWQLSVETMWWVFGGVFAFFIGGFWGKLFLKYMGLKISLYKVMATHFYLLFLFIF